MSTAKTIEKLGHNHFVINQTGAMNTDAHLYLSPELLDDVEDDSLKQLVNATQLKGVRYVGGMPDIHVGYGVPVGCVMGMGAEEGLVSAGAVGMDINCGMRLMMSDIPADRVSREELKSLGRAITRRVPVGVGKSSPHQQELKHHTNDVLRDGVETLVEPGFANEGDLNFIQDGGCFPGADLSAVTDQAWDRLGQLSTLGGGNHFMEIVRVDEVYQPEAAHSFGLEEGNLGVMIHTGSRGFGHQTCVDYSKKMRQKADHYGLSFPDGELASAPIHSELGQDYLSAMACAANVAYANRQMIGYDVRQAFREQFDGDRTDASLRLVYDITHNLARYETVRDEELLVHRKGAIRALPAGHPDNPPVYEDTGHPVLIPGNMATGSYVLTAGDRAEETCWSVNHGAGRTMSRNAAKDQISEQDMMGALGDVQLLGASRTKIRDEAPQAYKNVVDVIDVLTEIDIARKVAHLEPKVVIKGD
jgi:tRNA-splicing ligase RtcB